MQQFFDNLSPVVVFAAFIVFDAIVVTISLVARNRSMQALRENWQQLGMRTGLSFTRGGLLTAPSLGGEYRRRSLTLTTFSRSSGRSSTTYTRITLALKSPAAGTLGLSPEGFLSGLGRALGMQDVQVGNERFDKSFIVKSSPPEFAPAMLGDPMLQDALLRLREGHSFYLELNAQGITYTEVGRLSNTDFLESAFNVLSDLADRVDGGSKNSMFS